MGRHIGIKKLLEKEKKGFYKVETKDNGDISFYIGIDRDNKLINIYLTNDFTKPSFVLTLPKKAE